MLVVIALVETVMLVFQDMVHGDDDILMVFAIVEMKVTHIVFRFVAARIGLYFETVQGEAERKGFFRYFALFLNEKLAIGSVGFQFHLAMSTCEHGEQGAQQDQQDGGMQDADRHPFPQTAFHRHIDHEASHQCPQTHKPPRRIHMRQRKLRAMQPFDDGAGGKDCNQNDD